jgi:2-amino-4-hydroxy-6-hydroxymethyldihydropteridine diphosphokinase
MPPMRDWVTAYVALGANLGDPVQAVTLAARAVALIPGVRGTRLSSLYRSAPMESSGPDYVNAVMELQTQLGAPELLVRLQEIELQAGRLRTLRNAPRTLDLDILAFGDGSISSDALTIPHPRMHQRAFVLVPLAELSPERVRPEELLACAGQSIERIGVGDRVVN